MSYSVEWIEPISNRTYADVLEAEENPNLKKPIGCYNSDDLNRIENNTKYVMEDMLARKIIRIPPSVAIKMNWTEMDIPTRDDMLRIIRNVQLLMSLSNPIVIETFSKIYESTQFTYSLANAIEKNLEIMKNQPELPVKKWLLKVEDGIIEEYGVSAEYLAEDEIVTIKAKASGPDAAYMSFVHWSGDTNDLQYVGNVNLAKTTFQMKFHDSDYYEVVLKANFKVRFPRTLTLHGGRVYDDIGGTKRQFFAGDEILLLADTASSGKRFYSWKGTPEALENLTGGTEPSTSWLTMPDCDVDLTSFYINAGQHSVTVDGTIQGWYDYDAYVSIYPQSRGPKYSFSYWSGDTGYLEDVTSSFFRMPDVNVRFTSNWTYNYSYNTVNVIKGTINGASKGENLREGSGQTIVAEAAPGGYVFDKWLLEGVGSFSNVESATTTFYVGDGNAILTATYVKGHTVTIENAGNTGGITTHFIGEGKKYSISSTEVLTNHMFDYWNKNDSKYSNSHNVSNITMGIEDVTYTAFYRDRKSYQLTVNEGSGGGTYKERQSITITANTPEEGSVFNRWSGNYHSITNRYSSSTSIVMPSADCTVTAEYLGRIYHDVTVNQGSGSGRYYEGQTVTCRGDQAPATWEFSHWLEGENIVSYANPYRFSMGTSDRELTAVYKEIPYFTVTVINGTGSGTFLRNSNPTIKMNPAPEGHQFFQWEIVEGDQNDVSEPLAETTYIRNLTHNVIVKATYYVPNKDIQYNLSITDKEGKVTTTQHHIGEQVKIYADSPDEGYVFKKWTGDTQYVIDRYAEKSVVNMPPKNISLEMQYGREGATETFHVILYGGEILVETNPDTGAEKWEIEGEFEEGTTLEIRAIDIPPGYKFNCWKNIEDDPDGPSITTVAEILKPETTLRVEDFPISLARDVIERQNYKMEIVNGAVSGSYPENDPVAVYFNLESTETTKYIFTRWSGDDLAYIKLFSGESFDIFEPGNGDNPQIIRMPERHITITGNYDTEYRLKVNSGTIKDTGKYEEFYPEGTSVVIKANLPEEEFRRFSHWEGDISYLDSPYKENATVTMPKGGIELTAKYVNRNNQNDIALLESETYEIETLNSSEINLLGGDLEIGCIIANSKGHLYIVTEINETTLKVTRLTQKQGGNSNG